MQAQDSHPGVPYPPDPHLSPCIQDDAEQDEDALPGWFNKFSNIFSQNILLHPRDWKSI